MSRYHFIGNLIANFVASFVRPFIAASLAFLAFGCANPLRSAAAPPVLRLAGSFFQYQREMQNWTPATWRAVLEQMKAARMNTVIVQMLATENKDGSAYSFIGPAGQEDATEAILNFGDTNGFRVFLGLYLPQWGSSMTSSNFLFRLQTLSLNVAQQAFQRYLHSTQHPSFAGWYIPLETWTARYQPAEVDRLRAFFRAVHDGCALLTGESSIAISPFISGDRPPPCEVERVYTQILDQAGVDLVLLQDSVGAQGWTHNIRGHVEPYFQAFQRACATNGVRLWANIESFQISGSAFLSCDAQRLYGQLEAAAPCVEGFVTFDFLNYMNPVAFIGSWDQTHRDRMKKLYADYHADFVANDYAPFSPPRIYFDLVGGSLRLRWQANIGELFQVQSNATLDPASWRTLDLASAADGAERSALLDIDSQPTHCFYRIRTARLADTLVWIPPGAGLMGAPADDPQRAKSELPQFQASFARGFWISRFEVTQSEYQNVMCGNPSAFAGDLERPIESVSWTNAMDYCARLTRQELEAGRLPDGYVYRLPTELEWEYAARAGTTTSFSFGDDPAALGTYAWYGANSDSSTHAVGLLPPNPWGLCDTAGNVSEWCWDWITAAPTGPVKDFIGDTNGPLRAVRGGAWAGSWTNCRSSWRAGYLATAHAWNVGFRVVCAPKGG